MKKSRALNSLNRLNPSYRWLVLVAAVVVLTVAIAASTRAFRDRGTSEAEGPAISSTTESDAKTGALGPMSPVDFSLAQEIDHAIETSDFASARWGVCVLSLRDGRVLYARNADKLFTPASNMKIYTTAVALDQLGADYRWRTSVYAESPAGCGRRD